MEQEQLDALAQTLRQWQREELGDLPGYQDGDWSRRNLNAMLRDIELLAQQKLLA